MKTLSFHYNVRKRIAGIRELSPLLLAFKWTWPPTYDKKIAKRPSPRRKHTRKVPVGFLTPEPVNASIHPFLLFMAHASFNVMFLI